MLYDNAARISRSIGLKKYVLFFSELHRQVILIQELLIAINVYSACSCVM